MPSTESLEEERKHMKKLRPDDLSKTSLLDLFKREEHPLSINDLIQMVESWKSSKREVKKIIRELIREGSLVRLRNNRFGIPDEMNLQIGTLWCTRAGNGFVVSDKEGVKDVFVPSRYIKDALHGDIVVVRVEHTSGEKREGRIVKVNERKTATVTGFVKRHKDILFLIPDDERIATHFIAEPGKKGDQVRDGNLVAAKVTRFPEHGDPECTIVKVFPDLDTVKEICQFVVHKSGLSPRFPKSVESEAKGCELDIVTKDRVDLRSIAHVTIDGEFARTLMMPSP
jgi:ribonuclease R